MRKIILSFLLLTGFMAPVFAQKAIHDPNAEKRNISGFHGIDVATGINLILTNGSGEEVAVSASETEFRDKIITEVENGILKIHYETKLGAINKRNESKDLKAYVSYKTLDLLHVSTGAEVEIIGKLVSSYFELKATTGGLVKGGIDMNSLKISQSTGSKITLSGKVVKLEIDGDTGSKFMGENLNTNTCNVMVSTGAGVSVSVEKELNAKANTGGNIKYKGAGSIRDIKTSTGGSVSKI